MASRLLVLSLYGPDQAGTRLRATQFEPYLRAAGFEVEAWSFLSTEDSPRWFDEVGRARRVLLLLRAVYGLPRLLALVRRADVVLVLREVLPIASAAVERWAARGRVLVWDVDDTVWADYPRLFATWLPARLRRTATKYQQVAAFADEVWAGSEALAAWCRQHSARVVVVPTVVDVPEQVSPLAARQPTAGWVGSASTAVFLEQVLPSIAVVPALAAVECVGATFLEAPVGAVMRSRRWSLRAEQEVLNGARVGLYPMDAQHPLTAGKAGLKAVLYMAHGLPFVVTPTGATAALARHNLEALHAETAEQWRQYVEALLTDDELWERLSRAGHLRARELYSSRTWGPRLAARLHDLVAAR